MTKPAVLIIKRDHRLEVYSDSSADVGAQAWVLDWDNDMKPARLSAVFDKGMVHPLPIQKMTPSCGCMLHHLDDTLTRREAQVAEPSTQRNMVLAGLRTLQLLIEKDQLPPGIQESFFENCAVPTVESLDAFCQEVNGG